MTEEARQEAIRTRTIHVDGVITGESKVAFLKVILAAVQADQYGQITILINSPGGDAVASLEMAEMLESLDGMGMPITTRVVGDALSGAALVALGGSHREALPNSRMLVNNGRSEKEPKSLQEAAMMIRVNGAEWAEILVRLRKFIARRLEKDVREIIPLLYGEQVMDAPTALSRGFIHEIVEARPGDLA